MYLLRDLDGGVLGQEPCKHCSLRSARSFGGVRILRQNEPTVVVTTVVSRCCIPLAQAPERVVSATLGVTSRRDRQRPEGNPMRDLSTLPKVELHLHLEGTLEPETVLELARCNKVELPYADLEDLRGRYEFTDLQSLVYANLTVLQTEEDFSDLVTAYVARRRRRTPRRSVLRPAAPRRPRHPGPAGPGRAGVGHAAERDHGTTVELIARFHRDRSEEEALAMLAALEEAGAPIIGIGSIDRGRQPARQVPTRVRPRR